MKSKIIIMFVLWAICFICLLGGCSSGDNVTSEKNEETVTEIKQIVLNKFDHYDDVKKFAINREIFDGSVKVNYDDAYVKSGAASMAVTFQSIKAVNPSLPIYATSLGLTDISGVEEFGIYVYNKSANPFIFGLVAKNAAGEFIYNAQAEVAQGAHDLKFGTDRAILQYVAKNVYSFELQFIDIAAGTTVYVDELYARTTSEKVSPVKEIEDILSGISNLNTKNKTEVFNLYEEYKMLKGDYKAAISSYPILKEAVNAFYMDDLFAARREEPDIVLFFNEPFGEFQIEGASTAITTCNHTAEWAAEGENGSLKLEFMKSNVNWCGISTSAKIDLEDPYIYFTVFNDSDQRKMMALNWEGSWIIPANSEMTIKCRSTWLTQERIPGTTAHKAGGSIQVCGLLGDTVIGTSPEGTLYISAVRSYDPVPEIRAMRTGADSDTLFFFDRAIGQQMILSSSSGLKYSYSSDVSYLDEEGSLKLTFDNSSDQETLTYLTAGYEFNSNEYVFFNVYNDAASVVQLMLDYRNGVRLNPGQWTNVLIPAEEFDICSYFRFWSLSGALNGNLYISKATVISGDNVVKLAEMGASDTWTFGDLTLLGALRYDNLRTHGSGTLTNSLGYAPYLFGGEIQINYMEYPYGRITLPLKEPISLNEDKYFEITVRSDDRLDGMVLHIYNESGSLLYTWLSNVDKTDAGSGYTKYLFRIPKNEGEAIAMITIQGIGQMGPNDAMQFTCKDIAIAEPSAEQRAFNVLTDGSSYYYAYYHGHPTEFAVSGDDVTVNVATTYAGAASGFLLKNTAVETVYDLGFGELTFTLTTGDGGYCAVIFWEDTNGFDYLSDNYAATEIIENANVYYYASGTRITIDIAALANNPEFMNATPGMASGGLTFNVLTAASWSVYSAATTIALSDILFTCIEEPIGPLYTVSISSDNTEYGTVSRSSVTVPYGTAITVNGNTIKIGNTVVTATENNKAFYNRTFTGFTGYTATVTGDLTVTANFTSALSSATGADAYDYLVNNATTSFISGYHGSVWNTADSRVLDGDTIKVVVNQANSASRSFALSKAAVSGMTALGYGKMTFTVNVNADYFAISFFNDASGLNYLSGSAPVNTTFADGMHTYFYENGTTLTIDLYALANSSEFNANVANNVGLFFWGTNSSESQYDVGGVATITFSDISFTELTAEQQSEIVANVALNLLADGSGYYGYSYHGKATDIVGNGDDITYSVVQQNSYGTSGFALKNTTIKALYDLGVKEITFTLTTGTGGNCAIVFWEDAAGLNYLSNNYAGTQVLENAHIYYFASGTEVTIDIEALANNSAFMSGTFGLASGTLCFAVQTSSSASQAVWAPSAADTTITLSDITFTEVI